MYKIHNVLNQPQLDYVNNCIRKFDYELHSSNSSENSVVFLNSELLHFDKVKANFFREIFLKILKKTDYVLNKNIYCIRCYINFYPFQCGGDFHKDEEGGNLTILFFPCEWDKNNGGETIFLETEDQNNYENKKLANIVEYETNSALFFHSLQPHKANSHKNKKGRFSIAYKCVTFDHTILLNK